MRIYITACIIDLSLVTTFIPCHGTAGRMEERRTGLMERGMDLRTVGADERVICDWIWRGGYGFSLEVELRLFEVVSFSITCGKHVTGTCCITSSHFLH